jgi:hypothetical protein
MNNPCIFNFCLRLAFVASVLHAWPALAEWKLIDDNYLAKVYYDPDRMKKSTSYPEVWQLTDLKSKAATGTQSRQILIQYDCVDRRRRTLASSGHAQHMAQGKPIFTDVSQGEWHPVAKDTVLNTILEIACAKEEAEDYAEETQGKGTGKTENREVSSKTSEKEK